MGYGVEAGAAIALFGALHRGRGVRGHRLLLREAEDMGGDFGEPLADGLVGRVGRAPVRGRTPEVGILGERDGMVRLERREALHFVLEYYRGASDEPVPDRTITALVAELGARFPELEPEVRGILEDDAPLLVLNRVRDRGEREYLDRFRAVVEQNLALRCPELGTIPEDRRVGRATRDGRPFVLAYPRHPIARRFSEWAARLTRART